MSIKYHKRPQRFSFQLHKVSRGDKSTDTDKVGVTGALGSLGGTAEANVMKIMNNLIFRERERE